MLVSELTHDDIADIGAKWLRSNGYPVSFSNMRSATHGEQPDVLGFNAYGNSFLIEAKISRADFHRDKKKLWRTAGKNAVGDRRGYITPKGLLKPEEIPYGWWLLEVHGKTKPVVKVIKGVAKVKVKNQFFGGHSIQPVHKNCDVEEMRYFNGSDNHKPLTWLLKILRRAQQDGVDISKYAQGWSRFDGQ